MRQVVGKKGWHPLIRIRLKASDPINPEDYARWRKSTLGGITEKIEEDAIFSLAGDLRGKHLLDLGCGDGTHSIAASKKGALVTSGASNIQRDFVQ
jgi:predicted RNA methylase